MNEKKIVKVCGLREPENIREVAAAGADWLGLIFYPRSPRYAGNDGGSLKEEVYNAGRRLKKVGVFVDAPLEQMLRIDRSTEYYPCITHAGIRII